MEIGNLVFGNSRGEYAFPNRDLVNCKEWVNLLKVCECDTYGYTSNKQKENDMGGMRQGCFFCPNSPIWELAKLQRDYPSLWQELLDLNELYRKDKTQFVAQGFKYGMTFDEIINQVNAINNQITIFDLLGD
jgi:hypothetical protein